MSSEDRDERDPLQSLIADVLEAESRGDTVDREALIGEHPEHADSLREFFASHDQMKSAPDVDPPTLPPQSSELASENPTITPGPSPVEDLALPPNAPGYRIANASRLCYSMKSPNAIALFALKCVTMLLAIATFSGSAVAAELKVASLFSQGAVLQRDVPVPVWGTTGPGERIQVTFAGQDKTATSSATGKWRVTLNSIAASATPRSLIISRSREQLTVENVVVGEVWLCAGQSNMAMKVDRARNPEIEKAASDLPDLRVFTVPYTASREPLSVGAGSWVASTPETAGRFSATAFFFGRELRHTLDVPVGLIVAARGGSDIATTWTSLEAQRNEPALKTLLVSWAEKDAAYTPAVEAAEKAAYEKEFAAWQTASHEAAKAGRDRPKKPRRRVNPRDHWHHPGVLYNGMIAPLIPYAIRGVIWYQGETAIRYAWANHPTANLVNVTGLPASPFTTDIVVDTTSTGDTSPAASTQATTPARHPLHLTGSPVDFAGADNAGVGPGLAFAQTLVVAQPETRVLLIPCAAGGTSLAKWQKGQRLYEETIRRGKLALKQGPKGKTRIAGALWLQGEADSKAERIAEYPAKLARLIDDLRADTGEPDLPFELGNVLMEQMRQQTVPQVPPSRQ